MENITLKIIDEKNFVTEFNRWITHKYILFERTQFYINKSRIYSYVTAQRLFAIYLDKKTSGNNYDLATKILKYEDVLKQILPSEINLSYESSKILLAIFIEHSKKLLTPKNSFSHVA